MTTITAYYCSFCEAVNRFFAKTINYCERLGTYRAAAELTRQGFHKEAKDLMLGIKNNDQIFDSIDILPWTDCKCVSPWSFTLYVGENYKQELSEI